MKSSALFFIVFFITSVNLASASVIINEIFYDAAGSDENREWIEIFNPDNNSYELSNWKFFEHDINHGLTLSQGSFTLNPNSFAIIADDPQTFLQENPNFSGNLYDSSFDLDNDGESISLLDRPSGNQIDLVTYSSSWGGGEGISLERVSSSVASNESTNWHNGPIGGSPGSQNVLPSPTPTPTPTPIPTPTSIPTPTPTPKPSPTPTATPKPSPTPTPTPKPTATPIPKPSPTPTSTPPSTPQPSPEVLSGTSETTESSPEPKPQTPQKFNPLPLLVIISGLSTIGTSGYLAWRKFHRA